MAKDRDLLPFGETLPEDMSFQELVAAGVIDIAEIDDVTPAEQAELVGVPFILYEWEIKPSDKYNGDYAVCRIKTVDGTRVFADGGAGIQEQLKRYKARMEKQGIEGPANLYFHFGLRRSDYTTEIDGEKISATTFYFDNRRRP